MNDKINSFKEHLIETMWIIWKIRAILQAKIQNIKQVFNLFQELENNEDFKTLDNKVKKTIIEDLHDIFESDTLDKNKQGMILINKIRKIIDILDKKILDTLYMMKNNIETVWPLLYHDELQQLIDERFLLTNIIWKIKCEINYPIIQENRYQKVLKNLYKYNDEKEYWFFENQIKNFWDDIHKESCEKQKNKK